MAARVGHPVTIFSIVGRKGLTLSLLECSVATNVGIGNLACTLLAAVKSWSFPGRASVV